MFFREKTNVPPCPPPKEKSTAEFREKARSEFPGHQAKQQGGAAAPHFGGAAIAIKARDDAPSYSSEGASFDGAVIVRDGTIRRELLA